MRKKTSIYLNRDQQNAIIKRVAATSSLESEAIRYFIDRGIESERIHTMMEVLQLKIFYYLRQIAKERGQDFVNKIEADFADLSDEMLQALKDGFSHVGK
ncbi:MAG: hypothetical protein GY820_43505 [Gammaproteobacteria bacterium]|nr:hypothetical protein [Gammaproteobacteria bacterium]